MATSTRAEREGTATSVHCLLRAARRPSAAGAPPGLDGAAPVRVVDGGDGLWLVVSDVPLPAYDEPAITAGLHDIDWVGRHALAHERVVEHFLDAGALIPMKLFTLYHGDASALASLAGRRAALDRAFDEVQGRREWGVRILAAPASPRPEPPPATDGAASPGTAFLQRKQAARRAAETAADELSSAAEEVYRRLAAVAARARRTEIPPQAAGSRLLIDAAFLVPTRRARRFEADLEEARASAPELELALTGPWPAYHFIEVPV
jgi:hypothetical protein